jgi:hypothetical protein
MRCIRSNLILILIYATFVVAGACDLFQRILFHDVENWPSVSARILNSGGGHVEVRSEWWTGPRTGSVDTSYVEFEYSVDGQIFRSERGTPNGGGLPHNMFNEPWKAFYKPASPEVAVLAPIPYRAGGWLLATLVSGLVVITHLWFSLPGWLAGRRCRRIAEQAGAQNP